MYHARPQTAFFKDSPGLTLELFFKMAESILWRVRKSRGNKRCLSRYNKDQNPVRANDCIQNFDFLWIFDQTFSCYIDIVSINEMSKS